MKHIADPMEHPFCGVYCYFLTLLVPFYSYAKFMDMAAKGEILPEILPPTERVQHSLRVHLQAVAWQTLDKTSLGPLEWGWKEENSTYDPVMTDNEVVPPELLDFIRCKSLNNMCKTMLCSCRRYGLRCVSACGNCREEICENIEVS